MLNLDEVSKSSCKPKGTCNTIFEVG
jgi:hypothetical protein